MRYETLAWTGACIAASNALIVAADFGAGSFPAVAAAALAAVAAANAARILSRGGRA